MRKEKLQSVILSIAKDIDKICRDNDIEYFIDGGTLLGAVRHKGFIPWDDDFDIEMTRSNYNKFIEVCNSCLDQDKYFLETSENTEKYAFSFAKILLNDTKIIEDFSKDVDVHHGIFVDIFPMDIIPDNKILRIIYLKELHILKNLIWIKCGYGTKEHKSKKTYKILKFLANFFSIKQLKDRRNTLLNKYNHKDYHNYIIADYLNIKLLRKWYEQISEYQFEDYYFLGVKNNSEYLKACYGDDYMELPPLEKRVVHSNYEVDFGKYE